MNIFKTNRHPVTRATCDQFGASAGFSMVPLVSQCTVVRVSLFWGEGGHREPKRTKPNFIFDAQCVPFLRQLLQNVFFVVETTKTVLKKQVTEIKL